MNSEPSPFLFKLEGDEGDTMQVAKLLNSFPQGEVTPPPSKSDSHRAIICALLAAMSDGGISVVHNLGNSLDIEATLRGAQIIGAECEHLNTALRVSPGKPFGDVVDCGESGSTLRFLIPIAAALREQTTFLGRGKLMERPLGPYEQWFEITRSPGSLTISGRLRSGVYELPGNISSQFVSGLLLSLPLVGGGEIHLTSPLESRGYVDMTIAAMRTFGVEVVCPAPHCFSIAPKEKYRAAVYTVETDYSQAAFFLAAAALGREVHCSGLSPDSLQGDRAILEIISRMGAEVTVSGTATSVHAHRLTAVDIDAREIPDLVPPLAVLCCFCEGESHITGASRLRIKESDRLAALTDMLGKLGADIVQGQDFLTIRGKETLSGGAVDAWNDHRIAMAAAVAAIRCSDPVTLTGWESVNKSYPQFWEDFEKFNKEVAR